MEIACKKNPTFLNHEQQTQLSIIEAKKNPSFYIYSSHKPLACLLYFHSNVTSSNSQQEKWYWDEKYKMSYLISVKIVVELDFYSEMFWFVRSPRFNEGEAVGQSIGNLQNHQNFCIQHEYKFRYTVHIQNIQTPPVVT